MTGQDIINKFRIYTGDQSELSSQEELDLANKVYNDVLNEIPYEFLKKSASGNLTVIGDGTATITPPADFRHFIENNTWTDNSQPILNNASPKVIFIGVNFAPYQIVNWSDRRQYRNASGVCYYDAVNKLIVFPAVPPELSYEFDYIYQWLPLTLVTSPIFPADMHDMIYQGMAIDSVIITLFPRANSYAVENTKAYNDMLKKLKYYNSNLIMN